MQQLIKWKAPSSWLDREKHDMSETYNEASISDQFKTYGGKTYNFSANSFWRKGQMKQHSPLENSTAAYNLNNDPRIKVRHVHDY